MGDRSPADEPAPSRVPIHHLTAHQVELLRTVLRAGDVPFGISRGEVVAPAEHADEIATAVVWAGFDPALSEEFDDPDHQPVKRPLVKPPRRPLRDGRMEATRWRRLSAGLVDEALIGVPLILASHAGAPVWTGVVMHAVYHAGPTALYGWTIGKLWCGLRVTDAARLRSPDVLRAGIRWAVAAVPLIAGLFVGATASVTSVLVIAVNGPILYDLRGLHDLAAGTKVVERSPAGPGIWVRTSRRAGTAVR